MKADIEKLWIKLNAAMSRYANAGTVAISTMKMTGSAGDAGFGFVLEFVNKTIDAARVMEKAIEK